MKYYILFVIAFITYSKVEAQETHSYTLRTVVFYNVENLFDTIDNPQTNDDDRTPMGKDAWNGVRYRNKLNRIASVLHQVGNANSKQAPDIIGLAEIENSTVLRDLINTPPLHLHEYEVIHYESPDERGVDVGLLYKKASFRPNGFASRRVVLEDEAGFRDYTRDILIVSGLLDDEPIHILVNHWPSRSGGTERSEPRRIAAAKVCRRQIDSLRHLDPKAQVMVMGDFNDDPRDKSITKTLVASGSLTLENEYALYNPMYRLYKRGSGSLAYRDKWNLFDQIIISYPLMEQEGYFFWKAGIYKPPLLVTQQGRYKGYPFRTYAGGQYQGGYSDHFPVYIYLIKRLE